MAAGDTTVGNGPNSTTTSNCAASQPGSCGPIPAAAAAAGFTTCAFSSDFTQPLPAGWLDCWPGDGQQHQWYQGLWWHQDEPPCSAVFQTFDSAAGSTVLDLQWLPSYGSLGNGGITLETISHDTTKATDFPNAYYEATYRVTPTVANDQGSPLTAFWTWGTDSARGGPGPIEWDVIETYGQNFDQYDAGIHNWGNNDIGTTFGWWGTSSLPAGYDPTQYTTYGMRLTSDGSTQMAACFYVNNILIQCHNPQAAGVEFDQRNFLILNNGMWASTSTQTVDMYVTSIHVWSCADWQTTTCNGTPLMGPP